MNLYEIKARELIDESNKIRDKIDKKYEGQTFGLDGPAAAEELEESNRFAIELTKLKEKYPEDFAEVVRRNSDNQ